MVTCGWFKAPRPPEGLEGEAGALPWLGLPLRERQERAFLEARQAVDPVVVGSGGVGSSGDGAGEGQAAPGPRLLVREDVAIAATTVDDALALVSGRTDDLVLRLGGRCGAFADELAFGRNEPLLAWIPQGTPSLERIAAAQVVELDPQERLVELPVPGEAGADIVELPLTERILHPAGHWLQLLWANMLGLAPFLWRGLAGRNVVEAGFRLGWAAVRAGSTSPARVLGKLGRSGKDCRIHPSAVVEGCWLGDGVQIGAGALVRGSVLADGAVVEDQAMVEMSIVAPGARIQRQALAKLSIIGARAGIGGMIQLAVVDAGGQVKIGAHLMDMTVDQGARVLVGDRLVDAPLGLAGVCVGARTVVGAGVRIAPGRCLPPDLAIAPPPAQVVRRIPAGIRGVVTVEGGSLVPLQGRDR